MKTVGTLQISAIRGPVFKMRMVHELHSAAEWTAFCPTKSKSMSCSGVIPTTGRARERHIPANQRKAKFQLTNWWSQKTHGGRNKGNQSFLLGRGVGVKKIWINLELVRRRQHESRFCVWVWALLASLSMIMLTMSYCPRLFSSTFLGGM